MKDKEHSNENPTVPLVRRTYVLVCIYIRRPHRGEEAVREVEEDLRVGHGLPHRLTRDPIWTRGTEQYGTFHLDRVADPVLFRPDPDHAIQNF